MHSRSNDPQTDPLLRSCFIHHADAQLFIFSIEYVRSSGHMAIYIRFIFYVEEMCADLYLSVLHDERKKPGVEKGYSNNLAYQRSCQRVWQ